MRLNSNSGIDVNQFLLHSLGIGPVFTTLIIYYSFLLMPNHSNIFYLIVVGIVYLIIAILGEKDYSSLLSVLYARIGKLFAFQGGTLNKIEHFLFLSIVIIPISIYLWVYVTKILPQPLIGHDISHYGVVGDIFYMAKSLAPAWDMSVAQYGYAHGSSHAPGFSLLLTWERMVNSLFHVDSDFYFKSISTYYGLLIIGAQFHLVAIQNKWLAVISSIALISGLGFYIKLFSPHIDTFRIFFTVASFFYLAYAVKNPDTLSLILFGMFSGFTAYAHRIGIVTVAINVLIFFIMQNSNFKMRILRVSVVVLFVLVMGGNHYIFDLLWGRGDWINP